MQHCAMCRTANGALRPLACCGRMAHEECLLERMRACLESAVPAFRCAGCADVIATTGNSWREAFETNKRGGCESSDGVVCNKRQCHSGSIS